MEKQVSLHVCNLVGRGYTLEEALAEEAKRNETTPSPVAEVGNAPVPAEVVATGGAPLSVVPPVAQVDPPATPLETGAKPAWMP